MSRQRSDKISAIRDAIDRACRVVTALQLHDSNVRWATDSSEAIEEMLSRKELCMLRARERRIMTTAREPGAKPDDRR